MRNKKIIFFPIILLSVLILDLMYFTYKTHTNINYFVINKGESFNTFSNKIIKNNTKELIYLRILGKLMHITHKIQVGKYKLKQDDNIYKLLNMVKYGNVITNKITILEGSTYKSLKKKYYEDNGKDLTSELNKILNKNHDNYEGLLYPDTYYYNEDIILAYKLSYKKMESIINDIWNLRDDSLQYKNEIELLIVASLIEKETNVYSEKFLISDIIRKRIKQNYYLQIDSSILYNLSDTHRRVLKKHIRDKHNPYNTYRNKGLPPTPICFPNKDSIQAAAMPKKNEYMYFILSLDMVTHNFSSDLENHLKNYNELSSQRIFRQEKSYGIIQIINSYLKLLR